MKLQLPDNWRAVAGLAEGVSSLSVNGSDKAADAYSRACDAIVKSLRGELKEKGNEFNTDGYINVALILTEYFSKLKCHDVTKLADEVRANLEKRDNKKPFEGDLYVLIKKLGAIGKPGGVVR